MVGDVRRKAAFVADRGRHAFVVDDFLQRMKNLGAVAHRFAKARCTDRDDHQLLQIEVVVGVRAAVDDVHHRYRHLHRSRAAEITIQRQAAFLGGGARHRHADGQRGVGAEPALVVAAVEVDQCAVEKGLLARVEPEHRFTDFGIDVFDGTQHAFAEIAVLVAVAQLDRLARAGRRTTGHRGAAHRARFEQDVALDGRVTAAVEDFAPDDVNDCAHSFPLDISEYESIKQPPRNRLCRAAGGAPGGEAPKALRGGPIHGFAGPLATPLEGCAVGAKGWFRRGTGFAGPLATPLEGCAVGAKGWFRRGTGFAGPLATPLEGCAVGAKGWFRRGTGFAGPLATPLEGCAVGAKGWFRRGTGFAGPLATPLEGCAVGAKGWSIYTPSTRTMLKNSVAPSRLARAWRYNSSP